jgi:Ni/Co efflux regulator RcnB
MKRTILSLLSIPLLAMSLGAAPVMAGDHDHHDRGRHGWDGRHDNGHGRGHDDDRHQSRYDYREGYRDGYRADGHRTVVVERNYYRPVPPPRVYRPYGYERGHRYYNYYAGPTYVVRDYDRYRVRYPPHGYHWVRDDRGNLILVAIATGIITDLLLNH